MKKAWRKVIMGKWGIRHDGKKIRTSKHIQCQFTLVNEENRGVSGTCPWKSQDKCERGQHKKKGRQEGTGGRWTFKVRKLADTAEQVGEWKNKVVNFKLMDVWILRGDRPENPIRIPKWVKLSRVIFCLAREYEGTEVMRWRKREREKKKNECEDKARWGWPVCYVREGCPFISKSVSISSAQPVLEY